MRRATSSTVEMAAASQSSSSLRTSTGPQRSVGKKPHDAWMSPSTPSRRWTSMKRLFNTLWAQTQRFHCSRCAPSQVSYLPFSEAFERAEAENKLVHSILLWGALDDQSCWGDAINMQLISQHCTLLLRSEKRLKAKNGLHPNNEWMFCTLV